MLLKICFHFQKLNHLINIITILNLELMSENSMNIFLYSLTLPALVS